MTSKSNIGSGFMIKLIFRGHSLNFKINPKTVFLAVLLLSAMIFGVGEWYGSRVDDYNQRLADLEKANYQYRSALALKERENQQISALAEARFEDLCSQIENQDSAIAKINKTVGKKNTNRRSLRGSRMGMRHACIDLKLKYKSLIDTVSEQKSDIRNLQVLAHKYRVSLKKERMARAMNTTPSMWPVHGEISSDFGTRTHPVYGYSRFHSGLDIAAPSGQAISATAAGRVVSSGWMQGYGYAVEIEHTGGLRTLYGHCSKLTVSSGDYVKRGQTIALVGSTGVSTGPHCHYEVLKNGTPVNPVPYLY